MNATSRRMSFIVGVTTFFLVHTAQAAEFRDGRGIGPRNPERGISEMSQAMPKRPVRISRSVPMFVSFGQKPMMRAIEKSIRVAQAESPSDLKVRAGLNFLWVPKTRTAIVDLSTGCLSTSTRGLRDTFSFTVDNSAKTLTIDGDFWHARGLGIGTADCMGATTRRLQIDGLVPGTYKIVRHGRIVWTLELADREVNQRN